MDDPKPDIKDAPISNSVNPEAIKKAVKNDSFVSAFAKEGAKLLEETNKPNIITLEQFTPFIPLFNMDKEKYWEQKPTGPYHLAINKLYNDYIIGLGINLYQPTIVIMSKEDPTEVYYLAQRHTRIKSDKVDGKAARDMIPGAISKTASMTRDQLIIEASVRDVVQANNTPEQRAYFARVKMQAAVIEKNFVERNMAADKRQELMTEVDHNPEVTAGHVSQSRTFLDDDDD